MFLTRVLGAKFKKKSVVLTEKLLGANMREAQDSAKYVFSQKFNPMTGQVEWETQNELYDYHQEIARSAYADMLHDSERNRKYFSGLKWAIERLRSKGLPVRVLDIGTGTGLLSMMAASLGADDVTACEAFLPVSKCAKKVMLMNGFADKIRLIAKRSTDMTVGPDGDMPQRANLLVTEVFDTELIGEGAVSTYNHAHKYLLEPGSLVVPARSTVFAQVVQSRLLRSWNRPSPVALLQGNQTIEPPDDISCCPGSTAVLDIQMSRLPEGSFVGLSDPVAVARFDFTGKSPIPRDESLIVQAIAKESGSAEAILFWWDLDMTDDGQINLSCAPWWSHPDRKEQPWRDHWMQAVFFPPKPHPLLSGQSFKIFCSHDEYSFWFDVRSEEEGDRAPPSKLGHKSGRPTCTCGYHVVCNPFRIGAINDVATNTKYISVLEKLVRPDSVCICVGDGGTLLPLMAAKLGAKKVYAIDSNPHSTRVLKSFVDKNNLQGTVSIIGKNVQEMTDGDINGDKANVILSEPYYMTSLLPWHNLLYWYNLAALANVKAADCRIMPIGGTLWAVGVNFKHLWKIRSPLHRVEGFEMEHFDELVQSSMGIADATVESQPLWEYESTAVTHPFCVMGYDFKQALPSESLQTKDSVKLESKESCNGVALWMEWNLDESISVARGGPVEPATPDQQLEWDVNSKQGVYFFPPGQDPSSAKGRIEYSAIFDVRNGDLRLNFDIK